LSMFMGVCAFEHDDPPPRTSLAAADDVARDVTPE